MCFCWASVQRGQKGFAAVARERSADRVVLLAHRRGGLHAKAAEVHSVPLGAEIGVGLQRAGVPGEHLAGISHHGHVDLVGHAPLVELLRQVRPGPGIAELQFGQGGFLLVTQAVDDAAHDLRPLKRQQAVKLVQVGRVLHHRVLVQALAAGGEIALQVSTERLDQRQPLLGKPPDVVFLLLGQGQELRLLVIVQDGQHVMGDPRQERSVVPAFLGVDVPHVLKAEIVGRPFRAAGRCRGRNRPSGRPGRRRRSCGAAPGPTPLVRSNNDCRRPAPRGHHGRRDRLRAVEEETPSVARRIAILCVEEACRCAECQCEEDDFCFHNSVLSFGSVQPPPRTRPTISLRAIAVPCARRRDRPRSRRRAVMIPPRSPAALHPCAGRRFLSSHRR